MTYYFFPELISESANTILTQLHDTLIRKSTNEKLKVVHIVFDNHSTQKNFTIVAYLSWLVKKNFLGPDGYFLLAYLVRGHTHNRLDANNSAPRAEYYRTPSITTGAELCSVFQRASHRNTSKFLWPIYDFTTSLEPLINRKVASQICLQQVHQLKITQEGIYTKKFAEENFSDWRGRSPTEGSDIEPLQIMHDFPDFIPNVVNVSKPPESRLRTLSQTFGSRQKVDLVLDEFLLLPVTPFISLISNTIAPIDLPTNLPETGGIEDIVEENDPEYEVKDILSHRWNKEKQRYEWRVRWGDDSTTWNPREDFLNADGTVTDIYQEYTSKHKLRYTTEQQIAKYNDKNAAQSNSKSDKRSLEVEDNSKIKKAKNSR